MILVMRGHMHQPHGKPAPHVDNAHVVVLFCEHVWKRRPLDAAPFLVLILREFDDAHGVGRVALAQEGLLVRLQIHQVVRAVAVGGDEQQILSQLQNVRNVLTLEVNVL